MFTVVFQRPANNISVKGSEKTREKIISQKPATLTTSSGLIVAYNHPSGNLNPSESDNKITSSQSFLAYWEYHYETTCPML